MSKELKEPTHLPDPEPSAPPDGVQGALPEEEMIASRELARITPSNDELLALAAAFPPPPDCFEEEEEPPF